MSLCSCARASQAAASSFPVLTIADLPDTVLEHLLGLLPNTAERSVAPHAVYGGLLSTHAALAAMLLCHCSPPPPPPPTTCHPTAGTQAACSSGLQALCSSGLQPRAAA